MTIPGLAARLAAGGLPVLRVHYSADPDKRPGTPAGDAWLADTARGYPGGTRSPRWRKEMEIDYGAFGGAKVFPDWEQWQQGPIVVDPFHPTGYRLYASYDHGWNNPAAYHIHAIDRDGVITTLWEFYADKVPVSAIAKIIKGQDVVVPQRVDARIAPLLRVFPGCPFPEVSWKVADPSMWAEDQPMKDEPNKAIADLFAREGVHFQKGERGADQTVIEWLYGHFWTDPSQPRYRIARTCPWLLWELGQQRYKDLSEHQALTHDQSEQLVDKHNHAWDGLKMFLKRFPPAAMTPKPVEQGGTFAWWRRQAQRAKRGQSVSTFRREVVR